MIKIIWYLVCILPPRITSFEDCELTNGTRLPPSSSRSTFRRFLPGPSLERRPALVPRDSKPSSRADRFSPNPCPSSDGELDRACWAGSGRRDVGFA